MRVNGYSFTLLQDGAGADPLISALSEEVGSIVSLDTVGNSASFVGAFQRALNYAEDDLVYFAEDDYLYLPDAVQELLQVAGQLPVDYVTLYDHPVRYFPSSSDLADLPLPFSQTYVTESHHWRTVESTCMTFASRVQTLRADAPIFDRYTRDSPHPLDRELFRHLQGIGRYSSQPLRRLLVGPIPSLATHCEDAWLSPVVDWQGYALTICPEKLLR